MKKNKNMTMASRTVLEIRNIHLGIEGKFPDG